jgi:azurin
VLVFAREFRLSSSRSSAPAGRVAIQLANQGEDAHDLSVRRDGGTTVLATTGEVTPGSVGALRVTLRPGRYVFFCAAPGHEALGMRSVLTVKAAR